MSAVNTPEAVETRSQRRAAANQRRVYILGAFVVVTFLILATLLQIQQSQLRTFQQQQCLQRVVNVNRSNQIWADLAAIESHSNDDPKTRAERLAVYQNAHLAVPICSGG